MRWTIFLSDALVVLFTAAIFVAGFMTTRLAVRQSSALSVAHAAEAESRQMEMARVAIYREYVVHTAARQGNGSNDPADHEFHREMAVAARQRETQTRVTTVRLIDLLTRDSVDWLLFGLTGTLWLLTIIGIWARVERDELRPAWDSSGPLGPLAGLWHAVWPDFGGALALSAAITAAMGLAVYEFIRARLRSGRELARSKSCMKEVSRGRAMNYHAIIVANGPTQSELSPYDKQPLFTLRPTLLGHLMRWLRRHVTKARQGGQRPTSSLLAPYELTLGDCMEQTLAEMDVQSDMVPVVLVLELEDLIVRTYLDEVYGWPSRRYIKRLPEISDRARAWTTPNGSFVPALESVLTSTAEVVETAVLITAFMPQGIETLPRMDAAVYRLRDDSRFGSLALRTARAVYWIRRSGSGWLEEYAAAGNGDPFAEVPSGERRKHARALAADLFTQAAAARGKDLSSDDGPAMTIALCAIALNRDFEAARALAIDVLRHVSAPNPTPPILGTPSPDELDRAASQTRVAAARIVMQYVNLSEGRPRYENVIPSFGFGSDPDDVESELQELERSLVQIGSGYPATMYASLLASREQILSAKFPSQGSVNDAQLIYERVARTVRP